MSRSKIKAVLLIAHGSRRAEANDDLRLLAEKISQRRLYEIVEVSYLELAEPTIPAGVRKCVERGADFVLMLPYFLSAGRHVTSDLTRYREEMSGEFPAVDIRLCAPLGLHPQLVDVVVARLAEAETNDVGEC